MKKNLTALLLCIITYLSASAQKNPFIQWQKSYGGTDRDFASISRQTSDGGYIVAGATNSSDGDVTGHNNNYDYWIVKTDDQGNIQWQKDIGGSNADQASDIQETDDGGYIVVGLSFSNDGDVTGNHGQDDYWVVKLDAKGNILWQKSFGGSYYEVPYSLAKTNDDGYIIAGSSASNDGDVTGNHGQDDYWIVKLDADGKIQWQKNYGGSFSDDPSSIHQTADNGYIVAGSTYSRNGNVTNNHGQSDYWVLKLDASGKIQWQKSYGGSDQDIANSVQQTDDGGYIIAGSSASVDGDVTGNHGGLDYWVVKTDAGGNIQWQKSYGGHGDESASYIIETTDKGYVVAGKNNMADHGDVTFNRGSNDYWIIRLDAEGNIKWQKTLGGTSDDIAKSVEQTKDGGFIVAGFSYSNNENISNHHSGGGPELADFWLVKLSPEFFSKSIKLTASTSEQNCTNTNSLMCILMNGSVPYNVNLYRFGALYASENNVTNSVSFDNLTAGAYYATATSANEITTSAETDIMPLPTNTHVINITDNLAQLKWKTIDCADRYVIQFKVQGANNWVELRTNGNKGFYQLRLLSPATIYVWKVAAEKWENGIKAASKFTDTALFTTSSSAIASGIGLSADDASGSAVQIMATPNPAKNYFIINYKTDGQQKLNAMLYNINGKAVWNSGLINAFALNGKKVQTSIFVSGIYYLKITNADGTLAASRKIIVAK